MLRALFFSFGIAASALAFVWGADSSRSGARPLDLPRAAANSSQEEEDTPESILFWGAEYSADAFFFCFPAYDF
ncbi:MAG: hypothetical protein KDC38_08135 [Planctomycetes bacterium]|nr:hypothetical protein [Planctomycetota bacterium]